MISPRRRLKAVLFDSDGVLVDTERLFFEATRDAFAAAGIDLRVEDWARCYLAEGMRSPQIAALLGLPDAGIEETIRLRDERFQALLEEGPPVMPGVRKTLTTLRNRVRLILVTGASRSHVELAHRVSGCLPYFEIVVTRDDFKRPKPHPDAYLTALRQSGLEAEDCLAVEDSPRGAAAAIAAGIRCLVIPTALTDIRLCPPAVEAISSLARVAEIVLETNGR